MRSNGQVRVGLYSRWNDLALWVRWVICGSPLLISIVLYELYGSAALWLTIPGGLLVVSNVFLTWDDIGDTLRANVR